MPKTDSQKIDLILRELGSFRASVSKELLHIHKRLDTMATTEQLHSVARDLVDVMNDVSKDSFVDKVEFDDFKTEVFGILESLGYNWK